jgi:alkaline phosphatase D
VGRLRSEGPGSRRRFLGGALRAGGGLFGASLLPRPLAGAPAIATPEGARPTAPFGAAVGDVTGDRAIVWSRSDRPARLFVEWSTRESFADARRVAGPAALEADGFTARLDLGGLPPGQRIVYRVLFQDLRDLRSWSRPVQGSFRTPPAGPADVRFAFSADTCGQGWGIDETRGGMRLYESMRRAAPDLFVHCGDTVYADQPLAAERTLDDGTVWRNLVTPAKAKVAETLDEFRGNHLYNRLDPNVRRFESEVSQVVIWDDHEVLDNWYPGEQLEDPRYTERSVSLLAARARRAFLEHVPLRPTPGEPERIYRALPFGDSLEVFAIDMRSERGPNSANRQTAPGPDTALLGRAQLDWLKARLAASGATWKVVASDMPIGLVVRDGALAFEAVANGDDGAPLGREHEIAHLLSFLKARDVRNVVWITGDVHYAAVHRYDPERARFKDFLPFHEIVAGPAHAGTFGPAALDLTFGPEVRFLAIPPGMAPNRPPSDGLQFFGLLEVEGRSGVLRVEIRNRDGTTLHRLELEAERGDGRG